MSVTVEELDVAAYTIPTDRPESDGTLAWDSTTIVVVHATAGGHTGLGYTYAHTATADLIMGKLRDIVVGSDAMHVGACWDAMVRAVRNLNRPGLASYAIAAVDTALWDVKARLLGVGVTTLLDAVHETVPIYGSGGFTSYTNGQLCEQLSGWVADGIPRVKMKGGARDVGRPRPGGYGARRHRW